MLEPSNLIALASLALSGFALFIAFRQASVANQLSAISVVLGREANAMAELQTQLAQASEDRDRRAMQLNELQRTIALISMISPACKEPHHWDMMIRFMSKKERLPSFSDEDQMLLNELLQRLHIKETIAHRRSAD